MKNKIVNEYEYDGLGFPIILLNFPVKNVRGVEVPDIDYNLLQKNVLLALSRKVQPLTGNEVRFIRQYLEMTYVEFANKFGVTHPGVINWEKAKNNYAKILPTTELCIRLAILDHLHVKNKVFRDTFKNFNYSGFKHQKKQSADGIIILDLKSLTSI